LAVGCDLLPEELHDGRLGRNRQYHLRRRRTQRADIRTSGLIHVSMPSIAHLIHAYGLFVVAGLIGLESVGLPFPGETVLIVASANRPLSKYHLCDPDYRGSIDHRSHDRVCHRP
jgi:hypothetical protein